MSSSPIWLLPQGVSEILPEEAAKFEALRRRLLDELQSQQFQFVMPPMVAFLDNLIQGAGSELTTQTFKFPDYDSHKTLGIRADMTPQIAHIDCHRLAENAINRLCYIGTVLRTKPMTPGGSRELFQIGAEIFGDDSIDADKQIIDAMLSVHTVALKEAASITLSLSHIGIFSSLIQALEINENLSADIYDALLRKSTPDIIALNQRSDIDINAFCVLSKARGGVEILDQFLAEPSIKVLLSENQNFDQEINTAFAQLKDISQHLQSVNNVNVHIDLSELHGYQYHTGLTFQSFIEGEGRAIAKGGRYHGLSQSADSERPATGFSADLKLLASLS